jgi:predicted secreted protein
LPREGPVEEVPAADGRAFVRLPEIPTSGYVWQVSELPEGLRLAAERYSQAGTPKVAGGSGEHIFELDVLAPGSWEAAFELRRPWDREPLERRRVIVRNG